MQSSQKVSSASVKRQLQAKSIYDLLDGFSHPCHHISLSLGSSISFSSFGYSEVESRGLQS